MSSFDYALGQLKKDFQRNIASEVRKRRFHLSRSEKARVKHRKAIKRMKKREKDRHQPKTIQPIHVNKEWKFFD